MNGTRPGYSPMSRRHIKNYTSPECAPCEAYSIQIALLVLHQLTNR
jgi:hypothetical protein